MKIQGFTLLETLIYIALFGVLMSGALVTVYELLLSSEHNQSLIAIQEEGTFINRKLSWALSGATSVSIIGTSTLQIVQPNLGSPSPLQFSFYNQKVYLKRGSTLGASLVGDEFLITDATIETILSSNGLPSLIHVTYDINTIPFVFETYLHF